MKSVAMIVGLMAVVIVCVAVGQGTNELALIATIVIFPAAIALYFAPSIVAFSRGRPNAVPILLLNLFLGWTLIGWVGALIWAHASTEKASTPNPEVQPVRLDDDEKVCPYCAEKVRAAAIKCRHCGSSLATA